MAIQGLDRALAPSAPAARRMLDEIGGHWWNVYVGGPESGGQGWTPELVRDYADHGIERFMLTYVGRQARGPLTRAQGQADGRDAVAIAGRFGYSGSFPLCLDVELPTFEHAPAATVAYAKAWCETVRKAGARPGIYANPAPLEAMAKARVDAHFVWIASWVSHGPAAHEPHAAPGLPASLWAQPGRRAWQYAGAYGNRSCRVAGLDVDISVAAPECLASAPGHRQGDRPRMLRRGDHGHAVEQLTGRLSTVRSRASGRPYLDGRRDVFDREAEAALEAFQRDHRLAVDGVHGPETSLALAHAARHQQTRRAARPATAQPARTPPARLRALVDDVRRLEGETGEAWEALSDFAAQRRRVLAVRGDASERDLTEITTMLGRIEHTLETLVAVEERELALAQQHPAAAATEVSTTAAGAAAPQPEATVTVAQVAEPAVGGSSPPGATNGARGPRRIRLGDLDVDELERLLDRLERSAGATRSALIRRYVAVERRLAREAPAGAAITHDGPAHHPRAPQPRRQVPGRRPSAQPAEDARELQRSLNRFTAQYLAGLGPLLVDGVVGHATRQRVRTVKYYLGYTGPAQRSAKVAAGFERQLLHPRSVRALSPGQLRRGLQRRRDQRKAAKAAAAPRAGVTTFDGVTVAAWLVPYLQWARANGWQGTLQSGWRDPAYSESLCRKMCGAPTCAGRCAGRTSHHVGRVRPAGAVDVSDYATFAALMRRCPHTPRIFNALPRDPVHFSTTGN